MKLYLLYILRIPLFIIYYICIVPVFILFILIHPYDWVLDEIDKEKYKKK